MNYNILAINPGSTSTKVAVFELMEPLFELTLRHSSEEIAQFATVAEQREWRKELIVKALSENNYDIKRLNAVVGRGGILKPIEGGVYSINEAMKHDLINAPMEHASNLGGLIAAEIAAMVGVPSYIADPVVVDEMDEVARITGLPQIQRRSIFHALNQRATARRHCTERGLSYENSNFVVVHMGGGISVAAHRAGRIVDVNNAIDGDGPFAPERAGALPAGDVARMCFSGEYTHAEIKKLLAGKGGVVAHLGINAVNEAIALANSGDKKAALIVDALCYNVSKWVGAMATVLSGKVDAIIVTGGIAYNKCVIDYIEERCGFIAEVAAYPGENELEALVSNALGALQGTMTPKIYK